MKKKEIKPTTEDLQKNFYDSIFFHRYFRYGLKSMSPIGLSPPHLFIIFIYRYLYKTDASSYKHYIPKHNSYGLMEFFTSLSSYRNEFFFYVF